MDIVSWWAKRDTFFKFTKFFLFFNLFFSTQLKRPNPESSSSSSLTSTSTSSTCPNVFYQNHRVSREKRAESLGNGRQFRGCTVWFTGKRKRFSYSSFDQSLPHLSRAPVFSQKQTCIVHFLLLELMTEGASHSVALPFLYSFLLFLSWLIDPSSLFSLSQSICVCFCSHALLCLFLLGKAFFLLVAYVPWQRPILIIRGSRQLEQIALLFIVSHKHPL